MKKPDNIGQYIQDFPPAIQTKLEQMRMIIHKAAPEATEIISYGMPAFHFHGNLVYFAGNKNHIGFYPTSSGVRVFQELLSDYKTSKGAIQFPLDKPLPVALVTKIVKYRVKETLEKVAAKAAKPKG